MVALFGWFEGWPTVLSISTKQGMEKYHETCNDPTQSSSAPCFIWKQLPHFVCGGTSLVLDQ